MFVKCFVTGRHKCAHSLNPTVRGRFHYQLSSIYILRRAQAR